MKILALDYGISRVGVAVCDTEINIVFTRESLKNNKDIFENINRTCNKEKIEKIIIGYPFMLDGEESKLSVKSKYFAKELQKKTNIDIELINEQFTTTIAQQRLNRGICKKKNKKSKIDSASAQILLEDYLKLPPCSLKLK
jgi:putative holliday junction resolvase